ncbi:MAG: hypothetical protein IJV50_03290 [Lachnospiraceae bacterium]|nr:hypothetical protein [Lachnospiraceae bacterium]
MEKVYFICMLIGFLVPLFLLLFGSVLHVLNGIENVFSGLFDGIDGGLDVDIGDTCVSLLPFSVHSISGALLTFGVVGQLIYNGSNLLLANVIAAVSGYVIAVMIQSLIRRLKKEEHTTYATKELLLFEAEVINTIVEGGYGSICIRTPDGVSRTYPAKAAEKTLRLAARTAVRVVRFEGNVAIVEEEVPVSKYQAAESNLETQETEQKGV